MLGFVARFIGCFVLAAAVAVAVGDIARSLTAETLRLATIGDVAAILSGESVAGEASASTPLLLERLGALGDAALAWPAAPTLAAIAIVLLLLGRRSAPAELAR